MNKTKNKICQPWKNPSLEQMAQQNWKKPDGNNLMPKNKIYCFQK
jgi:hypothetical protein